jgi:hypothetical protein
VRLDVLAGLGLAAFALVCLYPALGAQLVLVDDHEIISFTQPGSLPPLENFSLLVFSLDPVGGRFRPMYWLTRFAEISVLRDNPAAWHVTVLSVGIACAVLVYASARLLGFNRVLALLLGAWLLVAPGVSSVWVRLGPNETFGTLFLCIAALSAVQAARTQGKVGVAWDVAFVLASTATFLSKESLVLLAPALALYRVVVGSRQKCSRSSRVPAACVLAIGVGLGLIATAVGHAAGVDSYGGNYLASPDLAADLVRAAHNLAILVFATSGWLILLLLPGLRGWRATRGSAIGALLVIGVVALVVVPQLGLYSNVGILEGKYELPAALAMAALVVVALHLAQRDGAQRAYRLGLGVFAASVVLFGVSTWSYASYFAADSHALHQLLNAVASDTAPGAVIGIAGDPARQYEPILSVATYLGRAGKDEAQVKLLPLGPTGSPYSRGETNLAQSMGTTTLMAPPTLPEIGCGELGAVIVLRADADVEQSMPCLSTGFRREDFSARVPLWGGDAVSLRPRLPGFGQITYSALIADRPSN